jgi:hypothetical protein
MATTYIGFYQVSGSSPVAAAWLDTGAMLPAFAQKVNAFPASLPASCKLIGSWAVTGPAPSVLVVEAESFADLQFINLYYYGYLEFDWHPTTAVPRDN